MRKSIKVSLIVLGVITIFVALNINHKHEATKTVDQRIEVGKKMLALDDEEFIETYNEIQKMIGGNTRLKEYEVYKEDEEVKDDTDINVQVVGMDTIKNEDISNNLKYTSPLLKEKIMKETIEILLDSYERDLGLNKDIFNNLKIKIIEGDISIKGEKKTEVYGSFNYLDNVITISSNLSLQDFFKSLQHEIGHFLDHKIFNKTDFNTFLVMNGYDLSEANKGGYEEENTDDDGKEVLANEFESLYNLNEEVLFIGLKLNTITLNEDGNNLLVEMVKDRVKKMDEIKDGVYIPSDDVKEEDGIKYVESTKLFRSLNYIEYRENHPNLFDWDWDKKKDNDLKGDVFEYRPDERINNHHELSYVFKEGSNNFVFDHDYYDNGDTVKSNIINISNRERYIPLNVFDIGKSEILYWEGNGGIYFWRTSYLQQKDI